MNPSRRRLLAALATAGSAGALTGSGTAALLSDRERFAGGLTTGIVDVVGEYWLLDGPGSSGSVDPAAPDGVVDGPHVEIPVGPLDDETPGGSVLLRFALPQPAEGRNNPVRLWLRTACPPAATLAEYLQVRLAYADANGSATETIASGSLRVVADALRTGIQLQPADDPTGEGCISDERYLLIEYDAGSYVGAETTAIPLFVAAVQCRNGTAASPFPPDTIDDPCEPAFACDCCWPIGKVEVDQPFEVGRTYTFDEGLAGYAIAVTAVDGDTGVAFELVHSNGGTVPPLCGVDVKGGPDDESYGPGDEVATDTDALAGASGGLVYAPENPNNGKRYAISYVLVKVCAPELGDGSCPHPVAFPAASGGGEPRKGDDESPGGPPNDEGSPPKKTKSGSSAPDGSSEELTLSSVDESAPEVPAPADDQGGEQS